MKKTVKHSAEFWARKYAEMKQFSLDNGIPVLSPNELISAWEAEVQAGSRNPGRDLKYSLRYNTDYKTARHMLQMARSLGDTTSQLKAFQTMSTQDFYDLYSNEIDKAYQAKKKEIESRADYSGHGASYAAQIFISQYWFGSL